MNSASLVRPLFCAVIIWFFTSAELARADVVVSFGSDANQFDKVFVPIGNPGNVADTTGNPNPAGSVGYHYNIGKYEVSRGMVAKASAAGGLGITLHDMATFGGNGANRPATGVNWNKAARFVNWLNISQGFQPAYKFELQPGELGYNSNTDSLNQIQTASTAAGTAPRCPSAQSVCL